MRLKEIEISGFKSFAKKSNLSFQSRVTCIVGPNGSGKTSLVNILATLSQSTGGTAKVAGIDVAKDPAKVREKIGLAGQNSR